jgi:ectoine hydroxylase-related dioxygenase (phytanoyl-CoA dioxygenase family)
MSFDSELPAPSDIDRPHPIDAATIADFRRNGHAVIRGLASSGEIAEFRPAIESAVGRLAERVPPIEERNTYGQAFLQAHNLWTRDERTKRFIFSARFAKAAADLMGVDGVRLYHDQALFKEPGGGHTPWHQDQTYWPLDTDETITMWMPLVDVPLEVGTMTFANGSHLRGDLGRFIIGDESEAKFSRTVSELGLATQTHGALKAGDATFHRGWTLHRAPANPTPLMRSVMTIIWYADGTRVSADVTGARVYDHKLWLDETPPGDVAAGPLNPLLWPR